jgi:hypothetical protein
MTVMTITLLGTFIVVTYIIIATMPALEDDNIATAQ